MAAENELTIPTDMDAAKIDDLRDCGRLFFSRGWSVGTSSNYSAVAQREPLQLLITVSGKDKGRLGPDDFVRVDEFGKPIDPNSPPSSAETMLHVIAARDPNVGAVLHTHSVWGTLLSDLHFANGGFAIEGFEMLKGLAGVRTHEHREWVPIFENTQNIPELADQVSAYTSSSESPTIHGYLIRNHGLYTWGADVAEARRHIEIFEFLFEVLCRKQQIAC